MAVTVSRPGPVGLVARALDLDRLAGATSVGRCPRSQLLAEDPQALFCSVMPLPLVETVTPAPDAARGRHRRCRSSS